MELRNPFIISSRLLPAIVIGGATIQLEYDGESSDGRTVYKWTIDLADGSEFSCNDLSSGCGGGSLQDGFKYLLSFLGAAGESFDDYDDPDSNARMFPRAVSEWAAQNSDELTSASIELEESTEELICE